MCHAFVSDARFYQFLFHIDQEMAHEVQLEGCSYCGGTLHVACYPRKPRGNCLILLDINNIYVSAYNHNFDPYTYLRAIPGKRVYQFHLAGHTNENNLIIDTHDHPIADPVLELYAAAVQHFGRVSTMIERDDHIPPLPELLDELEEIRRIAEDSFKEQVA